MNKKFFNFFFSALIFKFLPMVGVFVVGFFLVAPLSRRAFLVETPEINIATRLLFFAFVVAFTFFGFCLGTYNQWKKKKEETKSGKN